MSIKVTELDFYCSLEAKQYLYEKLLWETFKHTLVLKCSLQAMFSLESFQNRIVPILY